MPGQDDDLLARLNALKPSSVNLNSTATAPSIDVEVANPLSVEDKLADRLRGLRSGASLRSETSETVKETADSLTSKIKDEIAAEKDPFEHWQHGEDDEQTLDDLLADLGPDDHWKLDPDDPKNIETLLKEAKAALPPEQNNEGGNDDHSRGQDARQSAPDEKIEDPNGKDEHRTEDQQDEGEADDYVKRLLAEVEVEKKYGTDDDQIETDDKPSNFSFDLPSTPSNLPQPPTTSQPPSYEDSELEARFSKLGLDLPSTPNTTPSSRAKAAGKTGLEKLNKSKAKFNLPKFTDEDIDSWCCICNEDGEVKCLGCDGDIYCHNCWKEGHGSGPGQERGHKAVQYNRKGPAAAAAAA